MYAATLTRMATANTGTSSSVSRNNRHSPTPSAQITTIAPARCNAANTVSIAGLASNTFAPKSSSTPWSVTQAWWRSPATAVSVSTGPCRYPPSAAMIRGAAEPRPPAAAAAPAKDSSYQRCVSRALLLAARRTRTGKARTAHTSTSGTMQVISTIESAIMVQVSTMKTTSGTAHRAAFQRSGVTLSMTSHVTSTGTAVPV
jgi:hypothetical protein